MPRNDINIEQLFQELVQQDPSFAEQKNEVLGLLTRMTQHTPSVSMDPIFQQQLKDNLHQHIISSSQAQQRNQPVINLNRLARCISYGIPALALGVVVLTILPYKPKILDTTHPSTVPYTSDVVDTIPIDKTATPHMIQTQQLQSSPTPSRGGSAPQQGIPQPSSQSDGTEILESSQMMMRTSTDTIGGANFQSKTTLQANTVQSLQPTTTLQHYTDDTIDLSYSIDVSNVDLLLQGKLQYCNNEYIITEPLVGVSTDSTIIIQTQNSNSDKVLRLSLDFTNGLITDVKGLELCK